MVASTRFIVNALVVVLAAAGSLTSRAADIKSAETTLPRKGALPARTQIFEFDATSATVEILMTKGMKGEHENGDSGISVRKAADHPQISRKVMSRALLFNGGFSGVKTDRPVGLLISNGKVASVPNYATRPADAASSCRFRAVERYRYAGAICVGRDRSLSIGKIESIDLASCQQALQSGPLLVEGPAQAGVCESPTDTLATRTAMCANGNRIRVVLTLDPVSLFDLATWLADTKEGLGCASAINLSGDDSTGAVLYRGGIRSFTEAMKVGAGKFPQASLIFVHSADN